MDQVLVGVVLRGDEGVFEGFQGESLGRHGRACGPASDPMGERIDHERGAGSSLRWHGRG